MDAYDAIITGAGAGGGAPWPRAFGQPRPPARAATGSCASYLWPRHAYMENEIPVAGCAHQAGTLPVRLRSGHVGVAGPSSTTSTSWTRAFSRASGQRTRAHRDGQRAPRRRPPAHAAGLMRGER
jgi:hypothetical protein